MVRKNSAITILGMHTMMHCCLILFFLGGLATISYFRSYNQEANVKLFLTATTPYANTSTKVFDHSKQMKIIVTPTTRTCDLFSGKWVYDNKSQYPLYKEDLCPYLKDSYDCQTHGRKDTKYLQWRWQPHDCDFPRFDSNAVVEKLKGKRLLFVGDSISRNQYTSMICMLHSSIQGDKKVSGDLNGSLRTFRATDHNISIDFYWAPMLVESNGDSPTNHHPNDRMVRMETIEKHSRHWINADILVFNSYHWWRKPIVKLAQSIGSRLDGPDQVYEEIDYLSAYKMGLKAWSKWVFTQVDHSKTKIFFMGPTTIHSRAKDWRGRNHASCYGETEPVKEGGLIRVKRKDSKMLSIFESSLSKLKAKGVNLHIINVTQLTQYRKDGHITVYKKYWRPLTELQRKRPELASDCSHWCLPGVPDIWNELLLALLG
uniref:protein trichome birefringence-like 34 n=1 Tax=Erigeron canadensis TaxID=72917 RepID=UPI001CB93E50|nr:protein trichome birefringence-like 34 [Erigeron canadensis]